MGNTVARTRDDGKSLSFVPTNQNRSRRAGRPFPPLQLSTYNVTIYELPVTLNCITQTLVHVRCLMKGNSRSNARARALWMRKRARMRLSNLASRTVVEFKKKKTRQLVSIHRDDTDHESNKYPSTTRSSTIIIPDLETFHTARNRRSVKPSRLVTFVPLAQGRVN